MPTAAVNRQILAATTGVLTSRPSTASGNTPLATGPTTLFTVSGGRIRLIQLIGTVTTAIQAQATTTQLIATPSVGAAINLSNATADLTGAAVNATVSLSAALGTAVIGTAGGLLLVEVPVLLTATVTVTNAISVTFGAASTGALKWDLIWVPIDASASVVATA